LKVVRKGAAKNAAAPSGYQESAMPIGLAAGGRMDAMPNQATISSEPRRDGVSEFGARLLAARASRESGVIARPDATPARRRPARLIDLERRAQFGRRGFGSP
jgi:hypothetical protein